MIGELETLTEDHVSFIKENMREQDKKELTVQQWYDQLHRLPEFEHAYCYVVDGKPIAALGAIETDGAVHLWFFSTNEINEHWKTGTEFARGFISWLQRQYFGKHVMVQVMESHRVSMIWLKRLGFKRTIHEIVKDKEKLVIMEFKGEI